MNGEELLHAVGQIREEFVQEAEFDCMPRRRLLPRRAMLVAAALALGILLVGCAVVYVLHLENLKITQEQYSKAVYDEDGTLQGYEDSERFLLTLSGLKGTAGYEAAKEWYEYIEDYDADGTILAAANKSGWQKDSKYDSVELYSQEMADKVDEIVGKYSLSLPGAALDTLGQRDLLRRVGLSGILVADSEAEIELSNGIIYENGNYVQPFRIRMPEGEESWLYWSEGTQYIFRKDSLCTQMAFLEDTGDWQEWNYTTASGSQVLLLLSESYDEAWMFCDRQESFQSIRLSSCHTLYENEGTEEQTAQTERMTRAQLEWFADQLDFTISPAQIASDTDLLDTGIDSSVSPQVQGGWSIAMADAVTDGRTAYITLEVTAPDSVDISALPSYAVLTFRETCRLLHEENFSEYVMDKWSWEATGEHTLLLTQRVDLNLFNGDRPYLAEEPWELYLEDLSATALSMDTDQAETLWTAEGCWQFALPFADSDCRLVEMLDAPITVQVAAFDTDTGEETSDSALLTSFCLRSFGATLTFDGQGGDICSWDSPACVVLSDGSEIPLRPSTGGDGEYYLSIQDGTADTPIPLDQVAYVLLPDGQRLEAN